MPCINYGLWDSERNRINNGSNSVRLIMRFVYDASDSCKTILIILLFTFGVIVLTANTQYLKEYNVF